MAVTIKDVAREANVSIATVSLVIHNHRRISNATKNKVRDIIERLNYTPSRSARGLVSNKTGNIGFIITNDHFLRNEPFYTQIFIGTEIESKENDFYVLLSIIESDFKERDALPRFILDRNVDGVIVAGKVPEPLTEKLLALKIPVVYIDYIPKYSKFSTITVDNVKGGYLAVNHLIELGHKRIAFVGGDIEHPSIRDRLKGYAQALEKAGLKIDNALIETSEEYPARANGYNAAKKLFSVNNGNITAVFTCNDAMALGVIQYLRDNNRRVPDDISVIGFDDILTERTNDIQLSTVNVPKMEIGIEAMRLISALIKDEKLLSKKIILPVELVERQSTKKLL